MTYSPDLITRIAGPVIEMLICVALASGMLGIALVLIWLFKPEAPEVRSYYPRAAAIRHEPTEMQRYQAVKAGN